MKTFIFALLLLSSSAFAADEWTTGDTYCEVTFQVLNVIDWGQTRYIAKNLDRYYEKESAWLIGTDPSTEAVDTFMLLTAVLHPVVSYVLPRGWRDTWQYVTIGMKLNNTIGNAQIGIKVSF